MTAPMPYPLGQSGFTFEPSTWQPEVLAKMDTHHIVGIADDPRERTRFASTLHRFLSTQPNTEVCILHGRSIFDIEGLCAQLECLIPSDTPLTRTIDGPGGVASFLRKHPIISGHPPIRRRYFIYHDADILARANPDLFGQIAEVFAGVAGELEFAMGESTLLQRCLYLGGNALENEARSPESRLHTWSSDGPGIPFWSLVTGLDQPPTTLCSIETLIASSGQRIA